MDKLVSLCKRRGFVFQNSSIYGGLANAYDYGPLGVELLRNIKNLWWKRFVHEREDIVGIDSQIIYHPKVWEASGHTTAFFDPLVEDKKTHKRYRADHLVEAWLKEKGWEGKYKVEEMSFEELADFIKKNKIKSPEGNELTEPMKFNLLFETYLGSVEGKKRKVYLRGETAQGIFINFKNVLETTRVKLPFGIAQIGKAFRNEITTGQFIFRTFEFEQAEIEYFFDPKKQDWKKLFEKWQEEIWKFVVEDLGIDEKKLRWRRHSDAERSHYSKETYDLDFEFPFGFKELWGLAYRTDYDLSQHSKYSGQDLTYYDEETSRRFIPHVIEPSAGPNRMFLMVLSDSYHEEKERIVLKLKPYLAPYKAAIFPLLANKEELVKKARKIFERLKAKFHIYWDARGNIGKRYRYQDEIGTPYCITVDFQTLEDNTVTVRDRDTMEQVRVKVERIEDYLKEKLEV